MVRPNTYLKKPEILSLVVALVHGFQIGVAILLQE